MQQSPWPGLQQLFEGSLHTAAKGLSFNAEPAEFPLAGLSCFVALAVELSQARQLLIQLHSGPEEYVQLKYDRPQNTFSIDRRSSGLTDFNDRFPTIDTFSLPLKDDVLQLQIWMDQSVLTLFLQEGEEVVTYRFFPTQTQPSIRLFTEGSPAYLQSLKQTALQSIWQPH